MQLLAAVLDCYLAIAAYELCSHTLSSDEKTGANIPRAWGSILLVRITLGVVVLRTLTTFASGSIGTVDCHRLYCFSREAGLPRLACPALANIRSRPRLCSAVAVCSSRCSLYMLSTLCKCKPFHSHPLANRIDHLPRRSRIDFDFDDNMYYHTINLLFVVPPTSISSGTIHSLYLVLRSRFRWVVVVPTFTPIFHSF